MYLDRNHYTKEFDDILRDSVDEAFSSLGETVKKSLYFHLQKNFLISKRDIPRRVEDFSDALERIFGSGAKHLELLVMKNLYVKVNCRYKWEGPNWLVPDLTFKEYVELARVGFEEGGDRIGNFEVIVDAGERQEQRK